MTLRYHDGPLDGCELGPSPAPGYVAHYDVKRRPLGAWWSPPADPDAWGDARLARYLGDADELRGSSRIMREPAAGLYRQAAQHLSSAAAALSQAWGQR